MKLLSIYTTLALTAACLGTIGTAQAEVSAWTGCVTPGGSIIHLARGDRPKKPCKGNQVLIHLRDEAAFQNADANYKQGASCEAFRELKLSDKALGNLNCASTATLPRPGIVTPVSGTALVSNNFNVCGILKSETSESWKPSYQWIVPGGFVVSTTKHPIGHGSAKACEQVCEGDAKCIAANSHRDRSLDFRTCRTFHYSDTAIDWNHLCGYVQGFDPTGNHLGCADILGSGEDSWFVRVPDDQTVGHCLGAAPTSTP